MSTNYELSEVGRTKLEKHLAGEFPQMTIDVNVIPRRSTGNRAPLSFGQQQLWLLAQSMPDPSIYNECVILYLPGPLDVATLEQSFNEIIRRHEVWRTSFPVVDGQPVQMIHPFLSLPLPIADLRDLPEVERESATLQLAAEETYRPFDLAKGPLLRAILVRLGNQDHRLYLSLHHIIFDSISISEVFLPELHALYEAFLAGRPSPLPELTIQYADFAVWQREALKEDILADQLNYWKQQVHDAPAALELPVGRSRPRIPTYRRQFRHYTLSKHLSKSLKALSLREGVTLFITLVAAFQVLLYRYTDQDDLLIGTSVAGLLRPEVRKLLGYFQNTLMLRTKLSGNPSFRELLERVREVVLEAYTHRDVPFEALVKELQQDRSLSQNALSQVMLTVEPTPPILSSGWTVAPFKLHTGYSEFNLCLYFEDRMEGLLGRFEYNTDLFDESTIAIMEEHWRILLEGIVADPEQHIGQLSLLTNVERQQLLVEWNATEVRYLQDQCVHHLFEAQVERTPDAIAAIFEGEQLTYRELNKRANQLAHYLQSLGVGPEVLVGIYLERSLEILVDLLGILKAGGAYVPLDTTYPFERLAFMLQDTQMSVLLTQQHLRAQLPDRPARLVCLDTEWEAINQQSDANVMSQVRNDQLAYVIYTSGSAGQPKGILVEQSAFSYHCQIITQLYELQASDRVLQFSTITFDPSLEQILPALLVGATVVLRGPHLWTPDELAQKIQQERLSVLSLPQAYWHQVMQKMAGTSKHIEPNTVRLMVVGGDRFSVEDVLLWQQTLLRQARLLNAYGPTEAVIAATVYEVPNQCNAKDSIPIGRPLPKRKIYILDRHRNPVPIGVAGELYIGGDLLARGYLNHPELTAERFIPDPFSPDPRARLYKTGDRVRYRPDGNIEFLGRLDYQVKIRGFRVELGEIEQVLCQHPGVREAIVIAREDTPGVKRLVAYVLPSEGLAIRSSDLQNHLLQHVPSYMIPSAFVLLEAFPLSPNGKLDRRVLPPPESMQRISEETFIAPTQMKHYQLLNIWEELLDTWPIGIRDNFFYLGGHSLLAARLLDRIEQVFNKRIALSTLFAQPTIEQLVSVLDEEDGVVPQAPIVAVQTAGSKRPFFFLHGDPNGGAFHCFTLARELGADQPFYALEPYRPVNLQVPLTLETIAAVHLEAVRSVQPEGPYLLGGYCNGAMVAYEMARQLRLAGQEINLLVLLDPPPSTYHKWARDAISLLGSLMGISKATQIDWFLRLRHAFQHLLYPSFHGDGYLKQKGILNKMSVFFNMFFPPLKELRQNWIELFFWIHAGYTPGPYPGKITILWSNEGLLYRTSWRNQTPEKMEEYILPCTHLSWSAEQLHQLAKPLRDFLRRAQEGTTDSILQA